MANSKALAVIFLLWAAFILQIAFAFANIDLIQFGLIPRNPIGALGIFTCVFLHRNLIHLISNSIFLFVILTALFSNYSDEHVTIVIFKTIVFSGMLVWIMGRGGDSVHIGASGLAYGLATYTIVSSIRYKKTNLIIFSIIGLALGGQTLLTGMLTIGTPVSWEFHMMGAVAGIMIAAFEEKDTPLMSTKGDPNDQTRPHCFPSER